MSIQNSSLHVYKAHGIVLKRRNVGEADRIITLFTREYGKIRIIAKGVRRITSRRAPHLEVFRLAHVTLHKGRTLDTVVEVESAALLHLATNEMQKVSFAYYACELVDRLLPDGQEHREVFGLTSSAIHSLDNGKTAIEWQQEIFSFALKLLWTLGYLPKTITLAEENIQSYVEGIIERKLRTPRLLRQFG